MRHGWLEIPNVQTGDRTLSEQMLGLNPVIAEARGKTVLDLGTAEGCIALEFAKAGAASVFGCDYNAEMIEVANAELAKTNLERVEFWHGDIAELIAEPRAQFDIVLALAVLHKMQDPADGVRFCAESARDLIVIRLPAGSTGRIRGKHSGVDADVPVILTEFGFKRERKEAGPRGEWIHYYRRA